MRGRRDPHDDPAPARSAPRGARDGAAIQFLFLNSNPDHLGNYVVPCERVPCLEPSKTGKTAFSFTTIPRYTHAQMNLYKARKLGELDSQLAAELLAFAKTARTLPRKDLRFVVEALEMIAILPEDDPKAAP